MIARLLVAVAITLAAAGCASVEEGEDHRGQVNAIEACLREQGAEALARPHEFLVYSEASLRTARNAATVTVWEDEERAEQEEEELRFDTPDIASRLSRYGHRVVLWDEAPSAEDRRLLEACVSA